MSRKLCIIGDGAWGQALAHVIRKAGHSVGLWSRRSPDLTALVAADGVVLAIPAQAMREVLKSLVAQLEPLPALIICAKGIEQQTGMLMSDVVRETVPGADPLVLSGPSFAADVRKDLPTAVVMAASSLRQAADWAGALATPSFRIYSSDDVKGVEIGGALKNVLAIACGISDGRMLGDSARASLTTRGFAEFMRFGRAMGGRSETLTGLSGLGDLLLTCSSRQSRNYAFGYAIGEGSSVAEALAQSSGVVEGAATVRIAHALARRHGLVTPIVDAVHAIVDENASPAEEIARLLARPAGEESKDR